jgi:hypothetical protein
MDSQSSSTALPTVSIGGTEIKPLAYKGARVITTELLAKEFGASEKNLHDNFSNNSIRFAEGVHFFRVSGDELRALKSQPDFIGVAHKFASQLMLWTERGVFRHAKILETDEAWEAYERLESVYFAVREGKISLDALPLPKKLKAVGDLMHGFSRLAGLLGLKGNQRALSAAMATQRETGVNVLELSGVTHLDADIQQQDVTPTQIGERLTPKQIAARVNELLAGMGLQTRQDYKNSKGEKAHYWELTPDGERAGARYKDTTKKHSNGTPVKQIRWPVSVIAMVQDHIGASLI